MADNKNIRDGDNLPFLAATDELADGAQSPKVTLLAGDSTATPYRIDLALGALTEVAPATDTASSGHSGRLQRIAQRVTSLMALLPAALTALGNLKVAVVEATAISKSSTVDDAADVTLTNGAETVLLASDATRREAVIVADPANTVDLRIGKTGQVGAARGARLQPGQMISVPTTAAIYGYASAAAQKVSLLILKD